jgi:hypothetical protein
MGLTRLQASTITDSDFKTSCKVATTTDITDLTTGAPNTVDGVNLSVGDRILVKSQSNAAENGIYTVASVGTGSNGRWARATDFRDNVGISSGSITFIENGTNANTFYYLAGGVGTVSVGSTNLNFRSFSVAPAGSNTQIIFNNNGEYGASSNLTWNGSNLTVTGNAVVGNILTDGYYFANGSPFTVDTTQIVNGNSNVKVAANSNVTVSAAGNANILTVTGTGANISGTLNVTANATVGNILAGGFYFSNGSPFTVDSTQILNGNSNVKVVANSNVAVSVAGNSNIVVITGTGANITGNLNVTNTVTTENFNVTKASGFTVQSVNSGLNTVQFFADDTYTYGGVLSNGALIAGTTGANYLSLRTNSTDRLYIEAAGNVGIGTSSPATALGVNGTVTANTFTSNIATGTAPLTVTSTTRVSNLNVANAGYADNATTAGTVITAAQPNITSLGTLSSVTVTGNANVGNLNTTGDIQIGGNDIRSSTGNVAITLNDKDVTVIGNLAVQGATTTIGSQNYSVQDSIIDLHTFPNLAPLTADDGRDIGIRMHYFKSVDDKHAFVGWANDSGFLEYYSDATETNGVVSGTYGTIKVANVFANSGVFYNGTSNVTVNASGNVDISVGGTVDVAVFTTTGANIAGTLNATGNANTGNLGTGTVIATTANLTTINSGLMQNGNSNVTITANSNVSVFVTGNATARAVFTATGANIAGTLNATGNANVGNLGTAQVLASANITAPQLISNIAAGTAPLVVTSTTQVANLNAATAGSALTAGTVTTAAQPNITSVGSLTSLTVTGNANTGNLGTGTVIATTANLTTINSGLLQNGNSNVTITANANVSVFVTGNATARAVFTSTGANIAGTLNATGNANVGNLGTATAIITTGNITTVNSGLVQNGNSNVTITANANVSVFVAGNATARATFTSTGANLAGTLDVTGNVTVTNITANGTANLGAIGNVKITGGSSNQFIKTDGAGNLSFGSAGVNFTASTTAPSSPSLGDQWYDTAADILFTRINDGSANLWLDITSTANTFSSITVGANANVANLNITGNINGTINRTFALPNTLASATYVKLGTFTAAQNGQHCYIKVVASAGYNAQTAQHLEVNMHFLTSNGTSVDANGFAGWLSYDVTNSSTFSVITKAVSNAAGVSATAYDLWVYLPAFTGNGSFYTVEINNSTSTWAHAGTTGADPGAAANTRQIGTNAKYFASNILPSANATYSLGSTSLRYANIWGLASSAQYADLAEKYLADESYSPGTVVIFGGKHEITVTTQSHDSRVAGVISTEPAYLMNDNESQGNLWLPVALTGRVPCRVQGPVKKGDVLVASATAGVAEKIDKTLYEPGCVIGKSLENHMENTIKTIEVVVGRF